MIINEHWNTNRTSNAKLGRQPHGQQTHRNGGQQKHGGQQKGRVRAVEFVHVIRNAGVGDPGHGVRAVQQRHDGQHVPAPFVDPEAASCWSLIWCASWIPDFIYSSLNFTTLVRVFDGKSQKIDFLGHKGYKGQFRKIYHVYFHVNTSSLIFIYV